MHEPMKNEEEPLKLEWKDVLAIIIAQFQVLMPFVLITAAAFVLVFIFLMKVWIKV